MNLYLNTLDNKQIEVRLREGGRILLSQKVAAERAQGEKLLPAVEEILKRARLGLKDIEIIEVENHGGSFTSSRIGVAAANALGFALGVPVRGTASQSKRVAGTDIVEPVYDREPDIGKEKK
jgi:tRNA A37 threonylcarbamoyladenosine modification protein TsaB